MHAVEHLHAAAAQRGSAVATIELEL
jgi:hypothetical protein